MRRFLLLLFVAFPLAAADFEVGLRHVVSIPTGESGELDIPLSRGFSASGEWFPSERVSAHLAATFVNPEAILFPSSGGDVDLGTLGLDIYSLTARWHLAPRARLSAFAGGGGAFVVTGNLDDQFGEAVEAEVEDELTFVVEGGVRYRFRPRVAFELSAAYVAIEGETRVIRTNVALPERVGVDPVLIALGVSWRF